MANNKENSLEEMTSDSATWVSQVGEFAAKLLPHINDDRVMAFDTYPAIDRELDIAREISFKTWSVDKVVRARKVMKTAKPKVAVITHHVETSRIVTNKDGKTKRI